MARDIGGKLAGTPGLSVMEECSVGGLNIIEVVEGYDRLIILDSIRTTGGTPGDWHRFTSEALRDTMNLNNIHDVNFATALELGRRMGMKLPAGRRHPYLRRRSAGPHDVQRSDDGAAGKRVSRSSPRRSSGRSKRSSRSQATAATTPNKEEENGYPYLSDKNKVELAVLKEYGLRYSVLAAWEDNLRDQGVMVPASVSKPLEKARVLISSGCFGRVRSGRRPHAHRGHPFFDGHVRGAGSRTTGWIRWRNAWGRRRTSTRSKRRSVSRR